MKIMSTAICTIHLMKVDLDFEINDMKLIFETNLLYVYSCHLNMRVD